MQKQRHRRRQWKKRGFRPVSAAGIAVLLLAVIVTGCFCCELFIPKDPSCFDLAHTSEAPCREFWFGTDTMGRDLFSMVWQGGRISLLIGFLATLLSTGIGILVGTAGGLAPEWLDALLMRLTEIFLSIPHLLLIVFLQAILGRATVLSLSLVIGATGWTSIAKVVRTEVMQLRRRDYVLAAKTMGAGFFHILYRHLAPNFLPSILFFIVMDIRSAILAEATLSFMGLGLPLEAVSWGSMLSLSEKAVLTGDWWILLVPGGFLIVTLLGVTEIAVFCREIPGAKIKHRSRKNDRKRCKNRSLQKGGRIA